MANLSDIVTSRSPFGPSADDETNLDDAYVWSFTEVWCSCYVYGARWRAPGAGTATVEIWGAAGSSAQMCCCGGMVPANAPAYSKATFTTDGGTCICADLGKSCSHNDAVCFRGCSEPTQACIYGSLPGRSLFCMCAQGGRGSVSICHNGSGSAACCLGANGSLSFQNLSGFGNGCGVVCNAPTWSNPSAYGGDVNCQGCYSCTVFCHCNGLCWHQTSHEIWAPAGIYGDHAAKLCLRAECSQACRGGSSRFSYWHSLGGISRYPHIIQWEGACQSSGSYCGCYEMQGCTDFWPPAMPGLGGTPCSSVRDHGSRGGHGFMKITWKPSS